MTAFPVGAPVVSAGDHTLLGEITAAPAPGMRRVAWLPDHTPGDADVRDLLEVECAWFALCDHTATSLEPHPVLGPVPICDRCREKNERLRG